MLAPCCNSMRSKHSCPSETAAMAVRSRRVGRFQTSQLQACSSVGLWDRDRVYPTQSHRRRGRGCLRIGRPQGHFQTNRLTRPLCQPPRGTPFICMKSSKRPRLRFSVSASSCSNAGIGTAPASLIAKVAETRTAQGKPFDVAVKHSPQKERGPQCRAHEMMLFDWNENGLETHGDLPPPTEFARRARACGELRLLAS